MRRLALLAAFLLTASLHPLCAQNIITTVAGSDWIFPGVEGAAVGAPLGRLDTAIVDAAGNIFASDANNSLVVKISPAGRLTVVAGNGIDGFSGDGGPATSASLSFPFGLALDASGSLYVADASNHRVRKISPSGVISTVAGNGIEGFSGDGGPAVNASLDFPSGLAVDAAGNLYIADTFNSRVRRVAPDGVITTIAGNGDRDFSGDGGPASKAALARPVGLSLDSQGNLYIADPFNHDIRKVSAAGVITTIVGTGQAAFAGDNGPAARAALNEPYSVAVDSAGNLYIADNENHRIRKVTGGVIATVAGSSLFQFSGDGGPATAATISFPAAVAVDTAGNLYIAAPGNQRIRKVTPNGVITTIAGNGDTGFSGDGGMAINASFDLYGYYYLGAAPGLVVDAAGNLFVSDRNNHRVRKISTTGIVTTVAGNGTAGFSGDGGPATQASLHSPTGLALDPAGNLFIADLENHRVRKVSPNGTISTVAGSGPGFSGDGGPAVQAKLKFPTGVAFDPAGNLYIADAENNRVRRVTPGGVISTVAGNGSFFSQLGDGGLALSASTSQPSAVAVDPTGAVLLSDFINRVRKFIPGGLITTIAGSDLRGPLGDGGPASNASLLGPQGLAVDAAGNVYIAEPLRDRVRKVLAAAPAFSVSPATLTFSVTSGAAFSGSQQVSINSSVTGLGWSAQALTESGGDWLAFSPASGTTPGTVSVTVNAASLAPGTYRGTLVILVPVAASGLQLVDVRVTVQPAPASQLAVDPLSLTFDSRATGSSAATQLVRIFNAGSGSLNWTAEARTADGGKWLTVSPTTGSASLGSPSTLQVSVQAGSLASGIYSGSVTITGSGATPNQSRTIPVTLLRSQVTQEILISQPGLLFTGVEGGGSVPSQSLGIVNLGQGEMSWIASAVALSGGAWLGASPTQGRSQANSLEVPLVKVSLNTVGLRAGQYSGLVRVDSPGAVNSPQFVSVDLNVLPPGSNPGPVVYPSGLIFAARSGASSPGSQMVKLATPVPGNVEVRSGILTFDGGGWLSVLPRNTVLAPSEEKSLTFQPSLGSLVPGAYRGAVTLAFADGSPSQVVNVLFLVVGGQAGAASAGRETALDAECTAQRLYAVARSPAANFSFSAGAPLALEIAVIDDCARPVSSAAVVASFSNGDRSVSLSSLGNGIYAGNWRPSGATGPVTITVRANLPPLTGAELTMNGLAAGNSSAAGIFPGGVVNAASFAQGAALAPGSIVSVFGRNLAATTAAASEAPLPKTLAGVTLQAGSLEAPLFFANNGQINAQLPFEFAAATRQQVILKGASFVTVPETITLIPAQPGIFTLSQDGKGQGAILDGSGRLVDGNTPAAAGDVVSVYATGLGATTPALRSGDPAPRDPLAKVTARVEATIDGKPAAVMFAGLAPGFVGLYQVNVQIPQGVTPGAAVPLVLVENGVFSNTVTLAVK